MTRWRSPRAAAVLLVAVALAGCTGDDAGSGDGPDEPVGPLVAQDVVRLDLREAPTAQEAGIGPDRPDLVLSRVGDAIDTSLELPGGRLALDAFRVNIGAPISEPAPTYAGRVVVNVRSGDTAEVARMLLEQAPVLGIDPAEVEQWASRVGMPDRLDNRFFEAPATTTGPATSLEARWEESEGGWTVNYKFLFSAPPGTDG